MTLLDHLGLSYKSIIVIAVKSQTYIAITRAESYPNILFSITTPPTFALGSLGFGVLGHWGVVVD